MNNEKKIEIANNIISSLQNYINEITQLGNECTYTDRILDEIMERTDELTTDYKKICNETQKVYGVLEEWCVDVENGNSMVVFSDKDKALKYMNGRIEEIKQEYDYDTYEENEDSFSAYQDGYYINEHTDIRLEELTINEYE